MGADSSPSLETAPRSVGTPDRTRQLLELLVFLFLIVPSMVLAEFAYGQEKATFGLVAWATMLRDLALVCLILYFVWRSGEGIRALGWRFRRRDILLGLVLFVPFTIVTGWLDSLFVAVGMSGPSPGHAPAYVKPSGGVDMVLALLLVVVVAISEETMFRGYLLLRMRGIGTSGLWAVILSSVIFALGHGYEGTAGVLTVGIMGAVFAVVYLWRRSLVAPMTMHFMQDFLGIVLLPLLGRR